MSNFNCCRIARIHPVGANGWSCQCGANVFGCVYVIRYHFAMWDIGLHYTNALWVAFNTRFNGFADLEGFCKFFTLCVMCGIEK
jgi:hypothetical protein